MTYIYLLRSLKDKKGYIGSTTDLERRVKQHNDGFVKSTKSRRPLILAGYQFCPTIKEASTLEKVYKKSHNILEKSIKRGDFKVIENRGVGHR